MWKTKKIWILVSVLFVVALGGWYWYSQVNQQGAPSYKTGIVKKGTISANINATGTISPVNYVDVSTNVAGKLEEVLVKENQKVVAGEVIARIDNRQAKARLDDAEATMNNAATDLERYAVLVSQGAVSQQTYDNARTTYEKARATYEQLSVSYSDSTITAPMSGTVIGEPLKPGQTISTGISTQMIIATIADLSNLEILITVDETDIGSVKEGAKVDFTVDAHPGKTFTGTVKGIALGSKGELGKTSSTVVYYTVRVAINPSDVPNFFPTMTARAVIHGEEQQNALVVPLAAVRTDKLGEYVYVMKNGKPERTAVTTGITGDTNIEVLKGLQEGDEIVVSGNVDSNSSTSSKKKGGPLF